MGPFETIELNAPGGIADYCRRYGPSLSRLSGADSSIYDGEKLNRILAQWGKPPRPEQIAAHALARPPACGAQGPYPVTTDRLRTFERSGHLERAA